jgi:hypothetical protein
MYTTNALEAKPLDYYILVQDLAVSTIDGALLPVCRYMLVALNYYSVLLSEKLTHSKRGHGPCWPMLGSASAVTKLSMLSNDL